MYIDDTPQYETKEDTGYSGGKNDNNKRGPGNSPEKITRKMTSGK